MSNSELKELIYSLENILKQDKRFKKNGDNKYKKNIKTLYINTLQNKKNLIYVNPIVQKQECPIIYERECPIVQKQECPIVQKQECPIVQKQECPIVQKQECPVVQKQECQVVQKQDHCIDDKIKHLDFLLKVNDQLDDIEKNKIT
jgi:hypothetical protein